MRSPTSPSPTISSWSFPRSTRWRGSTIPASSPRLMPLLARADIVEPVADALGELGGAEAVAPLVGVLNTTGPAAPIARALAPAARALRAALRAAARWWSSEFQAALAPAGAQRILDAVVGDQQRRSAVAGDGARLAARARGRAGAGPPARPRRGPRRRHRGDRPARGSAGIVELLVEQLRAGRRRRPAGRDRRARAASAIAARRRRSSALLTGPRSEIVVAPRRRWRASAINRRSSRCCRCWRTATRRCARRRSARSTRSGIPTWRRGWPACSRRRTRTCASPRCASPAISATASAVDALIERCADPDESVRRAAVEHLPFLDDPRAAGRLRARARRPVAARPRRGGAGAVAPRGR